VPGARLAAPPALNPLDDIQALSGLDVEKASRRTLNRLGCRGALQLSLQLVVLRAKKGDPSVLATNELALVVVGAKRPCIKESDQDDEPQHDEPARARPLPPTVGALGSSGLRSLPLGHGLEKF
jgi:hypothetical protein